MLLRRDTKIVFGVVAAIPIFILSASTLAAWAIANGASERWRLFFRFACHGIPRRCLTMFDVPMPICARCVGIYVGLLAGLLFFLAIPWVREKTMRIVAFAAATPLALDGFTQLFGLRESTNPLRLATGLIAGLAFGIWVLSAVEKRADAVFTEP